MNELINMLKEYMKPRLKGLNSLSRTKVMLFLCEDDEMYKTFIGNPNRPQTSGRDITFKHAKMVHIAMFELGFVTYDNYKTYERAEYE